MTRSKRPATAESARAAGAPVRSAIERAPDLVMALRLASRRIASQETDDGILIGYARVAAPTKRNGRRALGALRSQLRVINAHGVPIEKIYWEPCAGPGSRSRRQFLLMRKDLRPGDTLVIHSLSAIGLDAARQLELCAWLLQEGIALKCLAAPVDPRATGMRTRRLSPKRSPCVQRLP